ncbi:MAG TPA: CoA transferase [Candidatus Dormibacteraeota bacterium]|nr:CoA transferase [Candidatus Dormibacteraeota bacterium]
MARANGSKPAQTAQGPLVGLRVLDFGQLIAGPMSATFLADWGADVVKVEPPGVGDSLRRLAPHKDGIALWWKVNGRNKRAIALDLKNEADKATFLELVKVADVAIENYSVGTTRDLGVDYETLKKLNPGLIYLSTSGFGQNGPYAHKRAFGRVAEAFSGMAYITGYADRPPVHAGVPVADCVSGVLGAAAIMAAVYERANNPKHEGQYIDLALYETPFRLMESLVISYDQLGLVMERGGEKTSYVAPVGTWLTKDGKYASFTGSTQEMVLRLYDAIGHPEMKTDPRFDTNEHRVVNRKELEDTITGWIAEHTLAEVIDIFDKAGVAIAPYLSIADIVEDPQYAAREAIITIEDDDLGPVRMQNVVPKFTRTPGKVRHTGRARIGHDQDDVLEDWLAKPAEVTAAH